MHKAARGLVTVLLAGGVAGGLLVACSTGASTAPSTAGPATQSPTGPAAALTVESLAQLVTTPTGTAATDMTDPGANGRPSEAVPDGLIDAVKENAFDEPAPGANAAVDPGLQGSNGQATWANTATSSYGASLSSWGYCGGGSPGFWITSYGFEWIRLSIWAGTTYYTGNWLQVDQTYEGWLALAIATPNNAYIVDGWDETPNGGDQRTVVTSFLRVPDLTYSTWVC